MTAGEGSKTQVAAMRELGLSLEQLEKMNPEQQFLALADAVSSYGNDAQAAGLAQRAFGTQIDQLLPLFSEGSSGINKMRKEARKLGITLTDADAKAAAKLTDAMGTLWSSVKGVSLQIGAALAESLTTLIDKAQPVVTGLLQIVKNNKQLIPVIGAVVAGITAAGAGFLALGTAITVAMSPMGIIALKIAAVTTLVGGGTAALLNYSKTARDVAGKVVDWFGDLVEPIRRTFDVVVDLLKGGRLELAADIGLSAMKQVWFNVIAELKTAWYEFGQYMVSVMARANKSIIDMQSWLSKKLTEAWGGAKMIWYEGGRGQEIQNELYQLEDKYKAGDIGEREYMEQKSALQQEHVDNMRAIHNQTDQAIVEIDRIAARWKDDVDVFTEAMETDFGGAIKGTQKELNRLNAEFDKMLRRARAEAALATVKVPGKEGGGVRVPTFFPGDRRGKRDADPGGQWRLDPNAFGLGAMGSQDLGSWRKVQQLQQRKGPEARTAKAAEGILRFLEERGREEGGEPGIEGV